jgi:hypothetical protein
MIVKGGKYLHKITFSKFNASETLAIGAKAWGVRLLPFVTVLNSMFHVGAIQRVFETSDS